MGRFWKIFDTSVAIFFIAYPMYLFLDSWVKCRNSGCSINWILLLIGMGLIVVGVLLFRNIWFNELEKKLYGNTVAKEDLKTSEL